MRALGTAMLLAVALSGCPKAGPGGPDGVHVSVRVLDESGAPIETATVRNPDEKERHPVNTVTGAWTGDRLYVSADEVVVFRRGLELVFEVSAPGYQTEKVIYVVRPRKNLVDVVLCPQALDPEPLPEPQIRFGRDVPRDGAPPEECEDD